MGQANVPPFAVGSPYTDQMLRELYRKSFATNNRIELIHDIYQTWQPIEATVGIETTPHLVCYVRDVNWDNIYGRDVNPPYQHEINNGVPLGLQFGGAFTVLDCWCTVRTPYYPRIQENDFPLPELRIVVGAAKGPGEEQWAWRKENLFRGRFFPASEMTFLQRIPLVPNPFNGELPNQDYEFRGFRWVKDKDIWMGIRAELPWEAQIEWSSYQQGALRVYLLMIVGPRNLVFGDVQTFDRQPLFMLGGNPWEDGP